MICLISYDSYELTSALNLWLFYGDKCVHLKFASGKRAAKMTTTNNVTVLKL